MVILFCWRDLLASQNGIILTLRFIYYSSSDELLGLTAFMPAPAALPAKPTDVVATLPATLTGTVTKAHEFNKHADEQMVMMQISFFMGVTSL